MKNLWENLKSEYDKNKEMKESLSKFREEAKKLEESEHIYVFLQIVQITTYTFSVLIVACTVLKNELKHLPVRPKLFFN